MILEYIWWMVVLSASNIDRMITWFIPASYERILTDHITTTGAQLFGSLRLVLSDSTWQALLSCFTAAFGVYMFRWIMRIVKAVRSWLP